jgi:hypothetical protein
LTGASAAESGNLTASDDYFPSDQGVSIVELNDEYRQTAINLLGDRFVEAWLTPEQDHFVVGVYNLDEDADSAILDQLETIAATELVDRQFTRAEVDTVANTVDEAISDGLSWTSLTVNYERGTVEVGIPPEESATSLAAELSADLDTPVLQGKAAARATKLFDFDIAGDDPKVLMVPTEVAEPAETRYESPLRAGKSIYIPGAGWCTSGFQVNGSGGTYIMTAGHRGPIGSAAYIANYPSNTYYTPAVGNLQNNTVWNVAASAHLTSDATVFHASSGYVPSTPSVFVNGSLQRAVVARVDAVSPYTRVCQEGMVSVTEACGYVQSTTADYYFTGGDGIVHTFYDSIQWQWDSGTSGVVGGDSGGPVYAVNADGTAIAIGVTSAIAGDRMSYVSPIATALSATGTTLATTGRQPFGWIDGAAGGAGRVSVSGWVIDPDLARTSTSVHIYVGGPAGSGAPGYALPANVYRADVASAYPNTGTDHGFSATITTSVRGSSVPIYAYGIDIGGSFVNNALLSGNPLYVSIT